MSKKGWGIGLGVAGVVALVFFGIPVLIVIAYLLINLFSQFNGRTTDMGSGQEIRVQKTVTQYEDWNTGRRQRTEYKLVVKGSKISSAELKKLLDVSVPGITESLTIVDAVELQANDFLLMLSKESQTDAHVVTRIHLDAKTAAVQTELIKLGGQDSVYNRFLDSRLPGWARVVNTSGAQFMIRPSPFQVVPLGRGALAKVEFPFAFLASDEGKGPEIVFSAVDLKDGKISSTLKLNKACFSLPRFSFDDRTLDALDKPEDDDNVKYNYGPAWWAKSIEWRPTTVELLLKNDHTLAAPAPKVFSIQHVVERPAEVRSRVSGNATSTSDLVSDNEGEIDQIPVASKSCATENPNGYKRAQSARASAEQLDVASFCLQPGWPVDSAIRDQACGAPTRKKIFSGNGVTVNEVSFLYQPSAVKKPPIQIVVPEIESNGKRNVSVGDPEGRAEVILKEAFVLNGIQVLFKARSGGPWLVFLLTTDDKNFTLRRIGEFSYPSRAFSSLGQDGFLYDTSSGALVRKKPFGYLDSLHGLAAIQDQRGVAVFVDDSKIHMRVMQFTADSRMEQLPVSTLEVHDSCFTKEDTRPDEMTTEERQLWFNKYFVWSNDKTKVSLKTACQQR